MKQKKKKEHYLQGGCAHEDEQESFVIDCLKADIHPSITIHSA